MPKGKEFYEEIEKPFDQELIKSLCEDIQDGRAFCILQVDNEVHDQILEGFSEFYPLLDVTGIPNDMLLNANA